MKYSIVFTSQTGNTAYLADFLKEYLPHEYCIYFGFPNAAAEDCDLIFIGFWTDKGSCDESTKVFLKALRNQKVFLFGTAGFGGEESYFNQILQSVEKNIDVSVQVTGRFMCQGKMPSSVLSRYEKMLTESTDRSRIQMLIDNFKSALSHPNQKDLQNFTAEIQHLYHFMKSKKVDN